MSHLLASGSSSQLAWIFYICDSVIQLAVFPCLYPWWVHLSSRFEFFNMSLESFFPSIHESISILLKILNNLRTRFHHLFTLSYPVHSARALLQSRPSVSPILPAPGVCLFGVCSTGPVCTWILAPSPDLTWFYSLFLLQHTGLFSPQTPQPPSSLVHVHRLLPPLPLANSYSSLS